MEDKNKMIEDTYIEINTNYKQGVSLSEYRGTYSIVSVNESKLGRKFMQWCFPDTKKGVSSNKIPWQVKLGNARQARLILEQYIKLLKEAEDSSKQPMF